jgi:hypothetical protein
MTDNLRDQLHWRLGDRLLCGETVGLILPNYPMGRGPWHHMFTLTYMCRAVFRGSEGLLLALSRHQGASAHGVLLEDLRRTQAASGRDASIFTQSENAGSI